MKTNSLLFKTRLISALSAFLLIALTLFITIFAIFFDKRQEVRHLIHFESSLQKEGLETSLQTYQLEITTEPPLKKATHILYDPLMREILDRSAMSIYTYDNYYYYHVQEKWFKSTYTTASYTRYIAFALFLLIAILYVLHRYIQRSLKPLSALSQQIHAYGEGKKIRPLHFQNSDEVAALGEAFYGSIEKQKELRQSRSLLINTLMNAFKGSLTTLTLRTHLMQDEQQKAPLLANIHSMQDQLKQIKAYETLMSGLFELHFSDYYLNSLLDEALYELGCKTDYAFDENIKITVDHNVFMTALKALLMYMQRHTQEAFSIEIKENQLLLTAVSTAHKALDFQNLTQTLNEEMQEGLELYIANMILSKHDFDLKYAYIKEKHHFYLSFKPGAVRRIS